MNTLSPQQDKLNKSKLEFASLLKNNLGYKSFNPRTQKGDVYFYNLKSQTYQIIFVSSKFNHDLKNYNFDNFSVISLKEQLSKKHQHLKINVLYVIFQQDSSDTEVICDNTIVYVNGTNWNNKLSKYFPSITEIFKDKEIDVKDISPEDLKNPNSKLHKDLKKLGNRLNLSNLFSVWLCMFLFVILPFVISFLLPMFGMQLKTANNSIVFQLASGALTRDAVFGAGQWWRVLTYPFSDGLNYILLIFFAILIFIVSRYSEIVFKPWQVIVTFTASIVIYGFFTTIMMPQAVLSGPLIVVTSLYGLLYMGIYKDQSLTGTTLRVKTFIIPVFLFIYPLITGNYTQYLNLFMGFALGTAFAFVFKYNYNQIGLTFYYPFLIFAPLILIPLVIAVLPSNYLVPNNLSFFQTLSLYYKSDFMSKNSIINILENYYHIPSGQLNQFISF